jgi:hypothetical protein
MNTSEAGVRAPNRASRLKSSCRTWRRLAALALAAVVSACGGGGGGGGGGATVAPAVAPPAALTLASFSPASGGAGTAVTVVGTGFTGLQSAKVGNVVAAFTIASDTQLQLTVPSGAQTGRIELSGLGRTVLSASDFTVTSIPLVMAVTPTSVLTGGRITLTGTSLDLVREVRLNATVLPIVSQNATAVAVDVIAGATSGVLTLVDTLGVARALTQQVNVVASMTITSFSPASIVTGQALTINGTNLDRAVGVTFANGATASIASRTGTTRITVTVPDSAATGALRVRGNANDEIVSAAPLTVIPAIRVDANAVYRVAAGANVTMTGTGLTEVSGVLLGSTAATIVSRTSIQLVFTVPAGAACGAITLQSASQPSVAGGSVVVGAGCAATLAGIEFGQVLAQPSTDPRQRLVPGKETWARAFVVSNQAGLPAPTVRLTGYTGVTIRGTVAMAGPATLPVVSGATVPDSIRYDEAQSFNAELPAAWVAAGLSVRIEVDPEQRLGAATVTDATPTVGTPTRLDIVLVPVSSGGFVPTLPTTAAVLDELTRRFPIPRSSISVSVRQQHVLTNGDGLDTQTEWQDALAELRRLRMDENPNNAYRYYFGFVRRSGGSIAGIGYVPGNAALGWDSPTGWSRTMTHELGHNFGRLHAPCGAVGSSDSSYPYAGGALGPTPLVDSIPVALNVISPASQTDVMGYCSGAWFSDYNYRAMQTHLEGQPQLALATAQEQAPESELLLIAGVIGLDGVSFAPVQPLRGRPALGSGDYTLRMRTRDGRMIEHAFDAELVDHAVPPERHFAFTVVSPGPLAGFEVLRDGTALPLRASTLATMQRAVTAPDQPINLEWSESGGGLAVNWNIAARPYLSVAHVVDGRRTVVAINRTGGQLQLSSAGLPDGGVFEIGLSDGLNSQLVVLPR